MYNWRNMSQAQREEALEIRKRHGQPWHGPPHGIEKGWHHIAAACYEHLSLIGTSPNRMAIFEKALLATLGSACESVGAWCVLPNHYHALVQCMSLQECRKALGRLHGRTSFEWNADDSARGRKCWHRVLPKPIKSERHRWATINYIHHNPVHHGYAKTWSAWPFSSARQYLESVGRERAEEIWKSYPVLDLGREWDPPEL